MIKTEPCDRFGRGPPEWVRDREGRMEGMKIIYQDVSKRKNELIGQFKIAAGDVISIRGPVMEYMYIPTEIKRELVRFGMDCDQKG